MVTMLHHWGAGRKDLPRHRKDVIRMTTRATAAPHSLAGRFLAYVARTGSEINYASRRIVELQSVTDTRR
jgi:hypothetical protein